MQHIDILAVGHAPILQINRRIYRALSLIGWKLELAIPDHLPWSKDVIVEPDHPNDAPTHRLQPRGIVFLEAMASGIRVVGGNRDGSLDPLGDGVLGTAIDPENGEELASAICAALSSAPANADSAIRFKASAFTEHLQALVWSNFIAGH